jgi:hypothetical protein
MLVALETDTTSFSDDESVQLSLSVANATATDKDIVFNSGQQYEFYVLDNTGNIVWTYSGYNEIGYTMALVYDSIAGCSYYPLYEPMGGGTRKNTITVSWNGKDNLHHQLPRGTYTVYAVFTAGSYESNRKTVYLEGPFPIGLDYEIR